jgi:hypothetical protein
MRRLVLLAASLRQRGSRSQRQHTQRVDQSFHDEF